MTAPNSDDWEAMDEEERMMIVMDHHREAGVELPNERIHAAIHVIVENQIALGDETAAAATLERMIREGLDRHEAIHAIGSVLAEFMQALSSGDVAPGSNEKYDEALEKLTAAEWLDSSG